MRIDFVSFCFVMNVNSAANILISTTGTVKLADFGVATKLDAVGADIDPAGSPYWSTTSLSSSIQTYDTLSPSFVSLLQKEEVLNSQRLYQCLSGS
jgi:serine/threonine protein kinase